MSAALGSPYDVTGAAHLSQAGRTMIRLEGFADSVAYRAEKLREKLADFGDFEVEDDLDKVRKIWASVRDVTAFHGQAGDVWRISAKPSDGPAIGARLAEAFAAQTQYDWGGGLIWALLPAGADARTALTGIQGHARLERASDATKSALGVFQSQDPALEAISAGLRAKFDPRGILNPGLME